MGNPLLASERVVLAFDDPAEFRRRYADEIADGALVIAGDPPPGIGAAVSIAIQVKGLGAIALSGKVIRPERTGSGGPGALVALDQPAPGRPDSARLLYQQCGGGVGPPGAIASEGGAAHPTALTPIPLTAPVEAPAPAAGESKLQPGEILDGRFRIERHLASGGMGDVFLATHVYMKRPVALKLLNRDFANDPDMSARFQREAELVSQLESPNVVRVFDFGKTGTGLLFLAMEFVDGPPLDKVISTEGALSPERAVPLLAQVCEALAEAHDRGIVHRDLKPPNIMVAKRRDGSDWPKVLDFGIARLADAAAAGRPGVTRAGMVLGTPEYIAPEQALAGALDARTDIYALGVLAYEVLTGRLPFMANSVQKLVSMHLTQAPPLLQDVQPRLEDYPAVCAAVLKAMQKEKEQRHQDMRAFARALTEGLQRAGPPPTGAAPSPLAAPAPIAPTPQPFAGPACSRCGAAVDAASAFCAQCGNSLGKPCPRCGVPAVTNAAFCQRCGASLSGAALPTQSPPAARAAPFPAAPVGEAGRSRATPRELVGALAALEPALSREQGRAILNARQQGPVGSRQGIVLLAELIGAGQISDFLADVDEASLLPRRGMAKLLALAHDHGGALDWLDLDAAVFLFEGEDPGALAERAARAALSMRDAVIEERCHLDPKAPLSVRLAASDGSFDVPPDGRPSGGEAVEAARALAGRAQAGAVVVGRALAEAAGARVETKGPDTPGDFEIVGAKPPPVQGAVRLVAREKELADLEALLAGALAGEVRPVAVLADPGLGKTRLAEELIARARRRGFAVAVSRPGRQASPAPYASLASLLCDLCGVTEASRAEKLRPALEGLKLPPGNLGAVLATASVAFQPPGFTPGQAVHALRAAIAAVAQARHVLLVFDDLDRADAQSVEAFRTLCEQRQPRCLVVAFARPGLVQGRELGAAAYPLAPLTADGFAQLVCELLGRQQPPEGLVRLLAARAQGSPRLAIDWVQLLFERGFLRPQPPGIAFDGAPPELSDAALAAARVEAVGPAARRLLEAGCLLGDPFDAAAVEVAVGDPKASASWTRLERAGLVRPMAGKRYAVAAERYRCAAEARMAGPGRAALHRRLAQALQAKVLEVGAASAAREIALHLGLGGDHVNALVWWQRAAEASVARRDAREAALRLTGFAAAVEAAERAGAQAPPTSRTQRVQLLARASAQALVSGDLAQARALIEQVQQVEGAEAPAAAEGRVAMARVLRLEGQRAPAAEALAAAKPGLVGAVAVLARVEQAEQLEASGNGRDARILYEQILAEAALASSLAPWHGEIDLRARIETRLGGLLLQQGDPRAALAAFQRALDAWRKASHPFAAARLLANLGTLAAQGGKLADAERLYASAAEAAERCGDLLLQARQLLNLAKVQKLAGNQPGARQRARDAAELAKAIGWSEGVGLAQAAAP